MAYEDEGPSLASLFHRRADGMENSDRVYKLYVDKDSQALVRILMVVLIIIETFFVWLELFGGIPYHPPWEFILGIIFLAYSWMLPGLTFPSRISLSPDGRIEFANALGRKVIYAGDVQSIRPEGMTPGIFVVRANRKEIALSAQFDGFHDFLARLKAMNPNIELKGC